MDFVGNRWVTSSACCGAFFCLADDRQVDRLYDATDIRRLGLASLLHSTLATLQCRQRVSNVRGTSTTAHVISDVLDRPSQYIVVS